MKKVLLALVLVNPLVASAAGIEFQARRLVHVYGQTEDLARWNIESACREQFTFNPSRGQSMPFGVQIEAVNGEDSLYSGTALCVFRSIQD